MKKKIAIAAVAIITLALLGVYLTWLLSRGSAGGMDNQQNSSGGNGDVASLFSENRELLLKYVDTPSNIAIALLGLDGIVSDIREAAGVGLELTDKCVGLPDEFEDATVYQSLLDFNTRFLECNAKTLEVKENRDVGSFETALSNTLLTIKEYNVFLEEISENTGG